MTDSKKYRTGQIVEHLRFDYRGVIYAVDQQFSLPDLWYEKMAVSRPPKDAPWYHVMVDNAEMTTYVAERNLRLSDNYQQINHPLLGRYFDQFNGHSYQQKSKRL